MPEEPRRGRWRWSPRLARRAISEFARCDPRQIRSSALHRIWCYIRRLTDAYFLHQCSLMACACAYCALLSLVPLLVFGIGIVGFVVGGSSAAFQEVSGAINGYIPIQSPVIRETLLHVLDHRGMFGVFGLAGLMFGAHQSFLAMQAAMNIVWGLTETRHWLRQRLVAVQAALYTLVLLGADLAVTAVIAWFQHLRIPYVSGRIEDIALHIGLALVPMLLTTLLFAVLYRILPARRAPWRPVVVGAAVAALLWQLTKVGFGVFLIYIHSYNRLYGALSDLVILVVWSYYSMVILLFGAEIAADMETMRRGPQAADARAHQAADLAAATGKREVTTPGVSAAGSPGPEPTERSS